MYDVICIGSAGLDVFIKTSSEQIKHKDHLDIAYHLGEKQLIEKLEMHTGGGGTNTAVGFSRLGLRSAFLGAIGEDISGKAILEELKKEKVNFLGQILKENSGYSVILLGKEDRSILTYKGANNNLDIKKIAKKLNAKWIYLSSMMEKSLNSSISFVQQAKKQGTKIVFNPSMYLATLGIRNLEKLLNITDILILNKEEIEGLTKKKMDQAIKELSKIIPEIIVTDGKSSITLSYSDKIKIFPVKPLKVTDSTGAGDAFAVGYVYARMKSLEPQNAIKLGIVESASVLEKIGAKPGLLRKLPC